MSSAVVLFSSFVTDAKENHLSYRKVIGLISEMWAKNKPIFLPCVYYIDSYMWDGRFLMKKLLRYNGMELVHGMYSGRQRC